VTENVVMSMIDITTRLNLYAEDALTVMAKKTQLQKDL
jgi:hypothetical protein